MNSSILGNDRQGSGKPPRYAGKRIDKWIMASSSKRRIDMAQGLEQEFHGAMLEIYRRAKAEANYNATVFLRMVSENGGLQAAKSLINSTTVSSGYTALWERGRLDLSVEAVVLRTERFHPFFTPEELTICEKRLQDYEYEY